METQITTTLTADDLKNLIKAGIREVQKESLQQENTNKSFSINQASKELGRSFTTVKNMILSGKLKTTSDGRRIPAQELNKYLKGAD